MKKVITMPSGVLSPLELRELKEAGYIVLVTDEPEKIKFVSDSEHYTFDLDRDIVLDCALKALNHGNDCVARDAFSKLFREELLKRRKL